MDTPQRCRARADEAERLAGLVAYDRDRVRLARQAQAWRTRAEAMEAAPPPPPPPKSGAGSALGRLRRWLSGPGRRAG